MDFLKSIISETPLNAVALKKKYPDRLPVIVKPHQIKIHQEKNRERFLMPKNLTISNLIFIIRKQININENQAIFIFVNKTLIPMHNTIEEIYDLHNVNGVLYIFYTLENTFG